MGRIDDIAKEICDHIETLHCGCVGRPYITDPEIVKILKKYGVRDWKKK